MGVVFHRIESGIFLYLYIPGNKVARSVNCEFDEDFCGWSVVEPELQRQKPEGVYVSQGMLALWATSSGTKVRTMVTKVKVAT